MATLATGGVSIGPQNAGITFTDWDNSALARVDPKASGQIHTDAVYTALLNAAQTMENRLAESLKTYQEHPDVQANLQQLQYDLQSWNLALTTMTNIQKNMADALSSIASNFR
ncbi:MAG: hypothetical protein MJ109_02295 [Kiritimatiellae bacterium]|nr:hypothetical protein [Kiritimatiellia bacterium]